MAYTSGNTILDDEYNIFVSGNANGTQNNSNDNVNTVAGTGSGDRGYGQSTVSTVSAGTIISATQWANMLNKIDTLANHQGTSITSISNPNTGDQIAILSALSSNISAITSNRHNAANVGSTTSDNTDRTSSWNNEITMEVTATFGSADQLRYFFNCGGRLSLQFSRTGGSAENKNTGWSNLCTACGTLYMTGIGASKDIGGTSYTGLTKIGGSGSPSAFSSGYAVVEDYDGVYTQIFRQYDSTSNYTSNFINVSARTPSSTQVQYRVRFVDDADSNTDENVDGTLRTTFTAHYPSTTYLSNSWGTVTLSGSQSGS